MLDSAAAASLVSYLSDLCGTPDLAGGPTDAGGRDSECDRLSSVIVCEHRTELLRRVPGLRTIYLGSTEGQRTASLAHSEPQASVVGHPVVPQSPFRLWVSGLSVQLGGRQILKDFGVSVSGGQVLAVVGRNGVGKTTLLRALAGLQKHSGRVVVERPSEAGAQVPRLGMVFQNPDLQLFNPTVRQEMLYRGPGCAGVEFDMARYAWLIDALGLADYEETSPLLLSEGEKKRVALATVLMRDHAHGVLLDEPTLGQDSCHRAMLVRLAHALANAGQLVVLSTHDLVLAACADRMLLLGSDGGGYARIVADGPPANVLDDAAAWREASLVVPDWVRARPLSVAGRTLSDRVALA
jgi:energy-coupling factor transporter ATP-binding protein EcfA2